MTFYEEPSQYWKTALSDLQGSWGTLREIVAKHHPFPEWERVLFHIDEGTSWESVRNLKDMEKALLLIQNIVAQFDVPDEVNEWVEIVTNNLDDVFEAMEEGEIE